MLFNKIRYFSMIAFLLFLCNCSFIASKVVPMKDLPVPSGKYKIGTKVFTWMDEERDENFTEDIYDKRKIVVQIWYPIDKDEIQKSNYIDYPQKRIKPIAEQFGIRNLSPSFMSLVMSDVKNVKTNSEIDADISTNKDLKKHPLLLFSHGLGGMRMQNTIQIEELVSNGYIVVAPDHAYDANITIFEDNGIANFKSAEYDEDVEYTIEDFYSYRIPQITTRSLDLSFIINRINNLQSDSDDFVWKMIDLNKIGVFGHSFGGGTSLVSLYNNDKISACVALDGWIEPIPNNIIDSGLDKPFLYIGQEAWDDTLNYYKLNKLINNSNINGAAVFLKGTEHFDYTDTPYFNNITKKIGVSGEMPTNIIVDTLNYYLNTFFNKHLPPN